MLSFSRPSAAAAAVVPVGEEHYFPSYHSNAGAVRTSYRTLMQQWRQPHEYDKKLTLENIAHSAFY